MSVFKTFVFPVAVATSLLISACGGTSYSSGGNGSSTPSTPARTSTPSSGALVKTASDPNLGTILVNAQGLTLYRLSGEHAGNFICTNATCLHAWHPLTVPTAGKPGGVQSLGVVQRPDGTMQATYKGMPLYTFASDTSPGQANGQGIKDVGTWNAVRTAGTKKNNNSSSSTSAPWGSSYGY